MSKTIKYYLAKFFTLAVGWVIGFFFMIISMVEFSDQIGQVLLPVLTYFISGFFIMLFKVGERNDSKRFRVSMMMESFFLYFWIWDLIAVTRPGSLGISFLYIILFIFSTIVYFLASGLNDLENIRQIQKKTPLKPVILTSIQIIGFIFSIIFSLVFEQIFFYRKNIQYVILRQGLPILLTIGICVVLFITAWKTHKVKIENSPTGLLQDYQSKKNKILFRSALIALPIIIVVSFLLISIHPYYTRGLAV